MATGRVQIEIVTANFFAKVFRWCDHRPPKKTAMCPDFIEPPARD